MTETYLEKRLIGYARVSTYGQTLDSQLVFHQVPAKSVDALGVETPGTSAERRDVEKSAHHRHVFKRWIS